MGVIYARLPPWRKIVPHAKYRGFGEIGPPAKLVSFAPASFILSQKNRHQLEHLQTRIDAAGVCRQTTDYTCGPAAAVTALRNLGLPADEGKIAILSSTSLTAGTAPDLLAEALQNEYRGDGLVAEYRPFEDLAQLKQAGLTVAVVKFGFFVDHYVTVLKVTDSEVVIGDPLAGLDRMSPADFLKIWRFSGIVPRRQP